MRITRRCLRNSIALGMNCCDRDRYILLCKKRICLNIAIDSFGKITDIYYLMSWLKLFGYMLIKLINSIPAAIQGNKSVFCFMSVDMCDKESF
jgi:hypothetical protein